MAIDIIAIGTSLGGVKALTMLFSCLPDDFGTPIVVVLHRGPVENDHLVSVLQKSTPVKVQEATDKLPVTKHTITVAPADYHLMVDGQRFALSVDAPVEHARPSIDVLFESIASQYGSSAMGMLLTGGGNDGIAGLKKIKARSGSVLVQSPETSKDASLPQAALEAGLTTVGYPIDTLAEHLIQRCCIDIL